MKKKDWSERTVLWLINVNAEKMYIIQFCKGDELVQCGILI